MINNDVEKNLIVIKNTLDICKRGWYKVGDKKILLSLSEHQMKNALVFTDKEINELINSSESIEKHNKTCYNVWNSCSFEAADRIRTISDNSKILVLNFANPVKPGGGVRRGARAQEEDLCRKSTLLISLENENARKYYDHHRKQNSALSSDYMIISPEVEVFRNSDYTLSANPFIVSVLTCAAPIVTAGIKKMDSKEYETILYHRILGMLCLAKALDYESLILGAWGCGAFGNDAEVMSGLFSKALNQPNIKTAFKNIIMAVLDKSSSQYNFNAFNKYFGNL